MIYHGDTEVTEEEIWRALRAEEPLRALRVSVVKLFDLQTAQALA